MPSRSVERRAVRRQPTHDVGQERLRHALERADPDAVGAGLVELLDVGARRAQPRVDRACMLDETLSFDG